MELSGEATRRRDAIHLPLAARRVCMSGGHQFVPFGPNDKAPVGPSQNQF
jgi:hypothetical protein